MKGSSTLRRRMLLTLLACVLPMVAVITLLFYESIQTQTRAEAEKLQYTAQDMAKTLDRYNYGMYNTSDAFATDERFLEILDRDYRDNPVARQYAITYSNAALFESYARLVQQKKIDAVYVVKHDEVLDFLDPNQKTSLLLQRLRQMDVNAVEKFGKFFMYPLQQNFLTTSAYGETRRDHVVMGSRRVYSAIKSGYPYVHIFAVEEQVFYDLYQLQAMHLGAEVYVFTSQNGLISSTNEEAVRQCALPSEIDAAVQGFSGSYSTLSIGGQLYNAAQATCESIDWTVLVLIPGDQLTAAAGTLYMKTLAVIAVCLGVFGVVIGVFYHRFMAPMAQLEQSMRQVDAGNLRAYVAPSGTDELSHMMESYNAMLDSIRVGLDQQMQMERRKLDLEMQVLMSQINPHFLYNTLETIVWKAGEAGRTDIGKLAASLGKLYRLSIAEGLFVPLQRELEHVQMYMNIQQSRYGNKVSYDVRLHGCDATQGTVLKLILQPIVENSLLYGMEGLEHTLHIRISVRRRGNTLVLMVTDNGVGMHSAALEKLRHQILHGRKAQDDKNRRSTGIGLHNIAARLRLYAGKESVLNVWSLPGIGTQVTLQLPWQNLP